MPSPWLSFVQQLTKHRVLDRKTKESAFNAQNSYKFNEIDIGRCVSERPANVATLSSFFFWCLCGLIGVRCTREEWHRRQKLSAMYGAARARTRLMRWLLDKWRCTAGCGGWLDRETDNDTRKKWEMILNTRCGNMRYRITAKYVRVLLL